MSRLAQAVAHGTEFGSSPLLLCLSIRRGHPGRTLSVTALLLALGLGFVSGLRTFTPVAAVMLVRGGIWGIVLAIAAVVRRGRAAEYSFAHASHGALGSGP